MTEQHDKPYGEKEALESLTEHQRAQTIERAVANIVSEIGHLDEDMRREVLKQALKMVKSSLVIRKSGKRAGD
jgi:hypothetical protein